VTFSQTEEYISIYFSIIPGSEVA